MSKRNRFDIDLPDDPVEAESVDGRGRRGPMATAVGETAVSLKERRSIEESIRAENDALAHEFVRLKKMGLVIAEIPISEVLTTKLVRDRRAGADEDLAELKTSIAEIGLSNPIQVEETEAGFELIQGFRRLRSYVELHAEGKGDHYSLIPAIILSAGETLEQSYRRMVDENLVRTDISFAEMGELARAYANSSATDCTNSDDAVAILFKSAGYQKRTYIRSFARLMELIGDALTHPETMSRSLGLAVLKRLEAEPNSKAKLVVDLTAAKTVKSEQAALSSFADDISDTFAGSALQNTKSRTKRARAKTTFQINASGREVKCIAGVQRLELSGETDFSAFERERLERAVEAFFDVLDKS